MHFKQILKNTLYLALLLSSSALIEAKNDCDEIENYLEKNVKDYREISMDRDIEGIQECDVNKNGEVISLNVLNYMFNEKQIDKIVSYNTITEFKYQLYDNGYNPDFNGYPAGISKMANLRKLRIINVDVPKGFAKGSSSKIEYLAFGSLNVQQQNIDDISTLTNLNELYFNFCSLDKKLDLTSLSKLKKLTKLKLSSDNFETRIELPRINNISSTVKKLEIQNYSITQNLIKDIATFTNLEELNLYDCNLGNTIDYSPLKKLTKLKSLQLKCEIDEKANVQLPTNLKKIKTEYITVSQKLVDSLSTNSGLEELIIYDSVFPEGINFDSFKNLPKLSKLSVSYSNYDNPLKVIPKGFCNLKNLKTLDLTLNQITEIPDEISNLQNLEELLLSSNDITGNLEAIGKLKNLVTLDLSENSITSSIEPLSNLKNLKELYFGGNGNSNSLEPLGKLTKIEILSLYDNDFKKIPESFENLTNLRLINLRENRRLEGKALTNKNIEYCDYFYDYYYTKVCATENSNLECKPDSSAEVNACPKEKENNKVKVSTNGKCGATDGKCPSGQCCSKYGYCGTTEKHCSTGCQSEFGQCGNGNTNTSIPVSTNGKCGATDGKCPSGQCCSKYGYCGTTEKHCSTGCQSEFGQCGNGNTSTSIPVSTNGKCGAKDGKCPSGQCCSKYGYCGTTDKHCSTGCQSEFGQCK